MEKRVITHVNELEILEFADEQIELAVGRSGLKKLHELTDHYWGHSRY
jgi:hypothetical protein